MWCLEPTKCSPSELEAQSVVHAVLSPDEILALMPLFQHRVQLGNQYWMNQVPLMPPGTFPKLPAYDSIIATCRCAELEQFPGHPGTVHSAAARTATSLANLECMRFPWCSSSTASGRAAISSYAASRSRIDGGHQPYAECNLHRVIWAVQGQIALLTAQLRLQLPTATNSTNQLCLAYCLIGNCNSNCARHSTHRPLTAAEEGRVGAFLTTCSGNETNARAGGQKRMKEARSDFNK
jgi:hypothetical protein